MKEQVFGSLRGSPYRAGGVVAGKFGILNPTLSSEDVYHLLDHTTSTIFAVGLYQTPKVVSYIQLPGFS